MLKVAFIHALKYVVFCIGNLDIKKGLEKEKAREILGGKSEAGFPILYGNPKQRLEQLKGYGGKRIEELRNKLKEEVAKQKNSKH